MCLILYVAPYYLRRNSVTYTPNKISITPQFTRPELLPQSWKLLEHLPRRYALHNLHNFSRRIARRCFQKYVHMIFHHFHSVHPHPILLRYPLKHFLGVLSNLAYQYMLPILRYPYQMVLNIKYGMFCPSYTHAAVIQENALFRQAFLPRLAASRFPPASKLTGIQRSFL